MTYVSIERLSFRYSKQHQPPIDRLSFTIAKGEIVGILGPSGSGKSTLLRLIAGLEQPGQGAITIAGRTVVDERTFVEAEHRGVGMVFQDYALFPHLNVERNVKFGLSRLQRAEQRQRVKEMLELVQLTDYADRFPHELSGGQQQRVALARALAPKPAILLMDEPFSNLDASLKIAIREELRQILRRAKMTSLLVSHDQADIDAICDRAVRLEEPERAAVHI